MDVMIGRIVTVATETRCPRCLFVPCLCADIPIVPTRTRVVIVRHHLERWRASNTGRLAALALPNSTVIDHGGHSVIPDGADVMLCLPHPPAFDARA